MRLRVVFWSALLLASCTRPRPDDGTASDSMARSVGGRSAAAEDTSTSPACDFAPLPPARYLSLSAGRVGLSVPVDWAMPSKGTETVHFTVPSLSTDYGRTEVYVALITDGPVQDLAAATDPLLSSMTAGSLRAMLADTMPDPDHRFVWWNGEHQGVPYSIFDDFAQAGGPVVHVLISMPAVEGGPVDQLRMFARDTDHLLSTLTVAGRRVFPGWTMHPTVECLAPNGVEPAITGGHDVGSRT
jgi:hypothetical protein